MPFCTENSTPTQLPARLNSSDALSVAPKTYWATTGVVLNHMMNSADQVKNCASASRFITGGIPAKSPTTWPSRVAPRPALAMAMATALAMP